MDYAADALSRPGVSAELEAFADDKLAAYIVDPSVFPEHRGSPQVPIEQLPEKFRILGGSWDQPPVVVLYPESCGYSQLRQDQCDTTPTRVHLLWGHGRHEIVIKPPLSPKPQNARFIRLVTKRVFVRAG